MTHQTATSDFIRVSAAKRRYFGGAMSLRWWYKQVEAGRIPHFRAGNAVLLRPADIETFVADMFCDKLEPEAVPVPAAPSPAPKSRSNRRGLRFFGD